MCTSSSNLSIHPKRGGIANWGSTAQFRTKSVQLFKTISGLKFETAGEERLIWKNFLLHILHEGRSSKFQNCCTIQQKISTTFGNISVSESS